MRPILLLVSVLVLSACSAGAAPPDTGSIAGVQTVSDLSHDHVPGPLTYDQSPPVGGPHNANWLRCEVYREPVPAEFAVHSMEHGGVWLTRRPDLPPEAVARLAALRELTDVTREYVLVSPYEGLPAPVVAATWGASLAVESADDPRLEQFVRTYAGGGQGGEKGVPCTSAANALTPQQAVDLLASQGG